MTDQDTNFLFSIVVPAYNYAHTLRRAIDSVLNQPGSDYELLVINDGSTDDTEALLSEWQAEYDERFRFVSRRNSGVAATRNYGVKNTTGRYLIFLDADDALSPDALVLLRSAVAKNPGVGMVVGGHLAVEPNGKEACHLPPVIPDEPLERVKQYLLDKTLALSNGAVAMNREIFSRYLYPEQFRNSEDLPMFAFVLANFSVMSVAGVLNCIYKHDDSLRHNATLAKGAGLAIVDEIFDPGRMPGQFQLLKERFVVQRLLSLSRTCYLVGDKPSCRDFFWQAVKRDWRVVMKGSYCRKFLKSLVS